MLRLRRGWSRAFGFWLRVGFGGFDHHAGLCAKRGLRGLVRSLFSSRVSRFSRVSLFLRFSIGLTVFAVLADDFLNLFFVFW